LKLCKDEYGHVKVHFKFEQGESSIEDLAECLTEGLAEGLAEE
jgi:hypothetical protein